MTIELAGMADIDPIEEIDPDLCEYEIDWEDTEKKTCVHP